MSERERLMLAVVEAAREAQISLSNTRTNIMVAEKYDPKWEGVADLLKPRVDALRAALSALDALPTQPQPQGETVEVRAAVFRCSDGLLSVHGHQTDGKTFAGTKRGDWITTEDDPRTIAIITARIPLPVAPTITATVTRGGGE